MTRARLATPAWLLPLAAAAMFWRFLFAGRALVWGTALLQFYPWESLAVRILRAGELPLWNAYSGNGAPLLANYQSAVFYPANWLYLLVPVEHGMGWLAALHVAWAGLGMYLLARQLGLPRFAALLAALAFEFNGYLITRLTFLSMTYAAAWMPWVLLAGERVLARRRVADAGLLGLVLGLQLLAGHAQLSAYTLVALGAYVLWRLWLLPGVRVWAASLLAAGVVLGFALAAVQLLPTAGLLLESQRASGVERDFGLTYSFWPWRVFTLFAPNLFGSPAAGTYWGYGWYHEDDAYFGLLPLMLAIVALAQSLWAGLRRRAPADSRAAQAAPLFGALAAGALFLSLGKNNPAALWLFDHAPGFSAFQAPARWNILLVLAGCLLAGVGAARWQARGPGPEGARGVRYWSRLGIAGAGVFTVSLFALQGRLSGVWATFGGGLLLPGALLVACGLLGLLQPACERRRRVLLWQSAVIVLVVLDLFAAGYAFNLAVDASVYQGGTQAAEALRARGLGGTRTFMPPAFAELEQSRRLSARWVGPEDPAYWRRFREAGFANTALLDGLRSANNFDPLRLAGYARLMDAAGDDPERLHRLARLMSAGVLIGPDSWDGEVVAAGGGLNYYRVDSPLPRAYAVGAARASADVDTQVRWLLLDATFEPSREVVLDRLPPEAPRAAADFSSEVHILHETANTIRISAQLSAPGWLVLSDSYDPGWSAEVDGRAADVLRANVAFRAVALPQGTSDVTMQYRPAGLQAGAVVSLAALFVLVALAVRAARRAYAGHPQ